MTITITQTIHYENVGDVKFTGTMYGVGTYYETCRTFDYAPWAHAEHLGITDPAVIALELGVTEEVMMTYSKLLISGHIKFYG